MVLTHLLEDLDEEPNLYLSSLLQKSIESSGALGFAQNPEPLLNSTQLVLEILVKCCRRHFLQCSFILVDVGYPLLRNFILGVCFVVAVALALLRLAIEVGGWSNATRG